MHGHQGSANHYNDEKPKNSLLHGCVAVLTTMIFTVAKDDTHTVDGSQSYFGGLLFLGVQYSQATRTEPPELFGTSLEITFCFHGSGRRLRSIYRAWYTVCGGMRTMKKK